MDDLTSNGVTRTRKGRAFGVAALRTFVAIISLGCAAQAAGPRSETVIEDPKAFPESITSTRDGTLIMGSVGSGGIFKAAPGAKIASQWIAPGDHGLLDTFGVLADEASNTLWVCSSRMDPPVAGAPAVVPALYRYDLTTGAFRSRHPLPGGIGLCSDIATGPDGAAYIAELTGGRILRLAAGAGTIKEWARSADLRGADGLDFLGNQLFVNNFTSGQLLRIELKGDGSAGPSVKLITSRPLIKPDGMRRLNATQFVLAEGSGNIDLLTVQGDMVEVRTLRSGLTGPAAVTIVGNTVWALESKLSMRGKPGINPSPFKAYAVALPR